MKKILASFIVQFAVSLTVYAQVRYEPGYIVDREGRKQECLIRNQDWRESPEKFSYKLSDGDPEQTGSLATVAEFGVTGFSRYVAADVMIDRSPSALNALTSSKQPVWSKEKLFLKILVEGKGKLYTYAGNNIIRFFFSIDDDSIKQLVFKEYLVSHGVAGANNMFRAQLWNEVRCPDWQVSIVKRLNYRGDELSRYFTRFNACHGSVPADEQKEAVRDFFNLRVSAGVNFGSLTFTQEIILIPGSEVDFEKKITPRLNVEAEFILPFHKNKWGLLVEPSWQSFKSKPKKDADRASVDYSFIEVGLGLRHYFYITPSTSIFLNAHYMPSLRLVLKDDMQYFGNDVKMRQMDLFSAGLGVQHARISGEVRYYGKADITASYINYITRYGRTSLSFGYRLVKMRR